MSKKPVLVIMAAGMGSRYGGLKQIDPVGPNGEIIIDYSLYDAKRAGFDTVICIIKPSIEKEFRAIMDKGPAARMNILYAYQDINDIPEGFSVPDGRIKPWGTAHAILAARDLIDGPFAIINADDYYGPDAFRLVYDYLCNAKDGERYDYCMVAYKVENTLSENGSVARGVCKIQDGKLLHIDERTQVQRVGGSIQYCDPDGSAHAIADGTPVSMNLFGFTPGIISELQSRLPQNLERILRENPLKGEFYIPIAASELIEEGKADMTVMTSPDRWYGVTYIEDKAAVQQAMQSKLNDGLYPAALWG